MKNIVELLVEREDGKEIEKYCERYEKLIPNPKQRFHSTVYFSTTLPIFPDLKLLNELKKKLPVVLNPETYFFDIFEGCLVLRYESQKIREINRLILSDTERQKKEVWPNLNDGWKNTLDEFYLKEDGTKHFGFNPHITFSKSFCGSDPKKLPRFDREISLFAPSFKTMK